MYVMLCLSQRCREAEFIQEDKMVKLENRLKDPDFEEGYEVLHDEDNQNSSSLYAWPGTENSPFLGGIPRIERIFYTDNTENGPIQLTWDRLFGYDKSRGVANSTMNKQNEGKLYRAVERMVHAAFDDDAEILAAIGDRNFTFISRRTRCAQAALIGAYLLGAIGDENIKQAFLGGFIGQPKILGSLGRDQSGQPITKDVFLDAVYKYASNVLGLSFPRVN